MGNIDRFKKRSAILVGRLAAIFNVLLKRTKIDRILVKVKQARLRYKILMVVLVLAAAQFFAIIQPFLTDKSYALGNASGLLSEKNGVMASKLKLDEQNQVFSFNSGQTLPTADQATAGGSAVSAVAHRDSSKGLTVTDPINKVDLTMTPQFATLAGKQDGNRIVYPLSGGNGWAVYTMQATGVKEDIVLKKSSGDKMSFDYKLNLGNNLEAKLEKDGSVGIYGNTLFSGPVATGSDKDAELLQKARKNAAKDTYLFGIPKPIVLEKDKHQSVAKAQYELRGDVLTIRVDNLKKGNYPLTIDPSIYVVTAQQFMAGNNETNINFDVDNKLIKKGRTTGARFNSWTTTSNLPTAEWGGSTVAAGGYIYSVGGTTPSGQVFSSAGLTTLTIPAGITSISVKAWGGGGGGGGGGSVAVGGNGAGAGFAGSTITVTPNETLNIGVGGGGGGGSRATAGYGGGGGGETGIERGTTPLIIAAGGGSGGGGRTSGLIGGAGGAGGGTSGVAGSAGIGTSPFPGGGGAGTAAAGGAGGTAAGAGNSCVGQTGLALDGGNGANGRTSGCSNGGFTGSSGGGFLTGGGDGGTAVSTRSGGGGAGSGFFGGGGGASATASTGGAGGGGGSSYTTGTCGSPCNTAGSGIAPGNSADPDRNGAGNGGAGGAAASNGSDGSGGILIVKFGSSTGSSSSVNWAKLNTGSGTIDNANPGNGPCSGWCSTSDYSLPDGRANYSLVAYNGYLYAMGGTSANCTAGNSTGVSGYCSTVYIAKLGANGEPRLWHPTDPNPSNWTYWYRDADLPSERAFSGAIAYNNRMYFMGGRTSSGATTAVHIADITPNGKLGTWNSSASTLPSSNTYDYSAQVYNDRLYILGGSSAPNGTPSNNVYYNKINNDGTINSWNQTSSFATGRTAGGGNFSVVWGAYIYISGGCSALNASGYCTTVQSDAQVASINADGSLDAWNNMAGVSDTRFGHNLIAWRDNIYEVGGCTAQNTSTGDCNGGMLNSINYGAVNQDGDASTVGQTVASGTAPCSGASPTGCNLPGTTYIGNMLNSSIITNGYIYIFGGCTDNLCSATSNDYIYAAISSTGTVTKPAVCTGGAYQGGSWCVNSTNTIGTGIAASSPVVYGGRIYLVGGLNGVANINALYYASANPDGSLGSWTSQPLASGTGNLGVNNISYSYAYARANPTAASSNPGNLFIFGGCTASSDAGCTTYSQNVYKCNIQTSGAIAGCSTSGQLLIGTIPGASGTGLGLMSGTVYANYVYLIGGVAPGAVDLSTVRYAKIDNNNNVVAVSGGAWIESDSVMNVGRRRAAAFGYNGYLYAVGGYEAGSGVLPDIEFVQINVSDGSLVGDPANANKWHVSGVQINQRWGLSVPVSNSYAYVIGGCTTGASPGGCTARTDVVQTFQVYNNDSGAPAGYTTSSNTYATNPNRIGLSSTILNGYIYAAGGCTSATDCTTAVNTVSYAPIDANGVVGSWSNTAGSLPAVRAFGQLRSAGGTLYYIGGQSSTATDRRTEIYYATPSVGNVSSWSTASNNLPNARTKLGATVWNNRLYVVGGEGTGTGCTVSNVCNTIYVSPQLNNGGNIGSAWSTASTSFNVGRSGATAIAYANNLYLLGGYDGTNYLSDTQYSQINSSNGNAGSWTYSESLPLPLAGGDGFAANGYIYLMGGRSAATVCDPVTLVAPISANTTIASGNNPTGIGSWYETNQRYTGARYGNAAVYADGKAYVLGGGCGATLTYASPVTQQTPLLSQPQVAKYSIMFDTDSDVFPSNWLLNGLDNSIGARWQLKYRSMTDPTAPTAGGGAPGRNCSASAMTTWGTETNFGNVTLALPGIYTPRDGSNANTNCARYYYFNVTVDSSQAFGYPDDVSRGPTITDLTINFTADPSKRLMHGRTFTGGLQMPIDTPYYAN